jgi:putative glutamine amidotransferase
MERPLVALTTWMVPEAGSHRQPQAGIYGAYVHALADAGLAAVLVTPLHDAASIEAILARCDGLVLSGGEDVDPARYGQTPVVPLDDVSAERDAMEWQALELAYARSLPVLAICRGVQVLNVFRGGTLWQDLPSQQPGAAAHQQTAPWGSPAHEIEVRAGSRLHAALGGATRVAVNSYHHQAIRDLAADLEVTAATGDGVIEAVEAVGARWVLGVQWHPERYLPDAPPSHPDRRLFRAFADAVRSCGRAVTAAG